MVCLNGDVQSISLEYFTKFFLLQLGDSRRVVRDGQPVVKVGSNVQAEMLDFTEQEQRDDYASYLYHPHPPATFSLD